ncbi:hypothetical protein FRC00_008255 [Tulasnella sp. 408]|nr:hypothetical protein FRC00_008255 [Tulasnella sp. 408]
MMTPPTGISTVSFKKLDVQAVLAAKSAPLSEGVPPAHSFVTITAAANVNEESSELSSPPPEEEIAALPAAKTLRTSANDRGGTTRSTKTSNGGFSAAKTPATRKAPKRSGRGYRAPSDSEEDDEEFGRASPSTAKMAAR